MNKELFDSMRKQMTPSPEVRAALDEKLAQPVKKRPVPWMRYGAVAACAALMVGVFSVYNLHQTHHDDLHRTLQLHSYVTVEGLTEIVPENTAVTGGGDTGAPNTGDLPGGIMAPSGALPGGAYIGDAPSQEEAVNAYQKLMDHFDGQYPDWYGGAYIDNAGTLVVQIVSDKDPGDKTLELQVLDWVGGPTSRVAFSSCKYSLAYLHDLQDKVVDAMSEPGLFSGCGVDEESNRLDLTLTSVTDGALARLAELDPDDDAIYVQVGQRATADVGGEDIRTDSAMTEDPAVHHVIQPGGVAVPVPEDEDPKDPIAYEPYYDGARYDLEHLPEELPQQKQPAFEVDSVPEEDNTFAFSPAQ